MVRVEFILVGCLLALVGLVFCIMGYNGLQPTTVDIAASIFTDLTGQKIAKTDKTSAYMMIVGGGACILGSVGFIIASRKKSIDN